MECHSKRNVTKNEMSLKLECYSNSNVIQNKMALKIRCLSFQDWVNFTLIPCLPSGSLSTIERKKCLVAFPTIFYANAVRPGFVFIEKLQNNDLTITSFAALRRPNNDIWRFQGWPVSILACFRRKKYLASKYTMSLNDTLYQSQEISTIFEMSQSESLHHF